MSSIQSSPEPWLGEYADFSRCYLMGDSAGGTMVHFLSLRIAEGLDIIPLRVCGQIIVQPFFGGEERTATELRLVNDEHVPLSGTDWLWRTCLPAGADRDHPLANPFGPSSPDIKPLARSLLPILFIVASGDPMLERQVKVFETLREGGSQIRLVSYQGSHGSQLQSRPISESLFKDVASFIQSPLAFLSKL
ncbi:hypothetical protein KP509_04G037200 [Ceratopteris richardii]|nr:hypothetical protein KP509_04G037200 [Ceratopteris richardii]